MKAAKTAVCNCLRRGSEPKELVNADTGGVQIDYDNLKWIIRSEDLILAGTITRPKPGDKITPVRHVPGQAEVYEVMPDGDRQCWEKRDAWGYFISIHSERSPVSASP